MTDPRTPRSTPSLRSSIPFWLLLAGSLAALVYGGWLVLDKIATMTTTLADGSATGVEVYVGQSWIVVGGAFLAAGLLGLVAALALAVVRSLLVVRVDAPVADEVADEVADDMSDHSPGASLSLTEVDESDVETSPEAAAPEAASATR